MFSTEYFELLDEIDNHKEITLLRLKAIVDDRTKLVLEQMKEEGHLDEANINEHEINI